MLRRRLRAAPAASGSSEPSLNSTAQDESKSRKRIKLKKKLQDHSVNENDERLETVVFGATNFDNVIGVNAVGAEQVSDQEDPDSDNEKLQKLIDEPKPAWEDVDDKQLSVDVVEKARTKKLRITEDEKRLRGTVYESRLRNQFEKINGRPTWASESTKTAKFGEDSDNDDDDDSDDSGDDKSSEFLRTSKKLLSKKNVRLPRGTLDCSKATDANHAQPSKSVIQAVQFHPDAAAMMTAGLDKTLRIFQVDGKVNRLLQSVHFQDLPIYSAAFTRGGSEIILSGRRKFFYVYDLQSGSIKKVDELQGRAEKSLEFLYSSVDSDMLAFTGRNGEVILVSNKTKQCVGSLKMNGSVNAVSFCSNSNKIISSGKDGKVYLWDLRNQRRCEHVFSDEGCISSTALAVSNNDQYIACGSDTGVVNIYDGSCFTNANPKPLKALMNLTTTVNHLQFHPDNQMLGMSSRSVKQGLRMVHLPSMSVFSNWPAPTTPLNYANTFTFSPRGGYLSVGNDKGRALLYRLNHYSHM
eukprot:m.55281 g.55281  ORF g.55281 m.55281 type:complete len:524 (-) comp22045_c0_seq2:444-2015(-)